MHYHVVPSKPDTFQSYTKESTNVFYGPTVRVLQKGQFRLGFVVHAWESIIAVALVSEDDVYENVDEKTRQRIILSKNALKNTEGLPRVIEAGQTIADVELAWYKFSINQWREITPKVGKKVTKFLFSDTKPDKLADSKVQRLLIA